MKTKFKTSTEENSIKKLLQNNNFRNNQNYVINKEKGHKIVREYDNNITKKILVGFLSIFLGAFMSFILFISIIIFSFILKNYINIDFVYFFEKGFFHFSVLIFSIYKYFKINKIGEKRFVVFLNNFNGNDIIDGTKNKYSFYELFNVSYFLVKRKK